MDDKPLKLMSKLNEVISSLPDEIASEIKESLLKEANAVEKEKSQLYSRAKKAEGFEKDNTGKWVKKETKPETKPELKETTKPNEPDYAKMAFLNSKGYDHPDDQKWLMDEAERLKMPLMDILGMEHAISKLTANKDQRDAQAGMPKGRGHGSGKTQQDVDYWLQKGETPDDQELAEKVIDARIKKEEKSSKFSDILFN